MSVEARIETLKERHAGLDARITAEEQRPRPDEDILTKLKLEKLHLKEEMVRLSEMA